MRLEFFFVLYRKMYGLLIGKKGRQKLKDHNFVSWIVLA